MLLPDDRCSNRTREIMMSGLMPSWPLLRSRHNHDMRRMGTYAHFPRCSRRHGHFPNAGAYLRCVRKVQRFYTDVYIGRVRLSRSLATLHTAAGAAGITNKAASTYACRMSQGS